MHVQGVGHGLLNVSNAVACFERFDEVDSLLLECRPCNRHDNA